MKKILILHTGGTFGMVPMKPSHTLAPNQVEENIITHVPELEKIAHIDFQMVFNIDSADMQPHHWQELATVIFNRIDEYDGFVVIHGTDSMSYTAAALSFMLRNLSKPVILTGSQRPLAEIRTDAKMNLINAVELATYDIPEVCIFFGTRLLRGNRAIKSSSTDYGAFVSPNFPPLAQVGLDIKISSKLWQPQGALELLTEISDRVLAIPFFPGMSSKYLHWLEKAPFEAIILEGLGLGNVAARENSLVPLVEELTRKSKLVVITSQSRYGQVDLSRYRNGQLTAAAGAIGAGDMTTETTLVKLMHLLGNYPAQHERVNELLLQPLAGELSD